MTHCTRLTILKYLAGLDPISDKQS